MTYSTYSILYIVRSKTKILIKIWNFPFLSKIGRIFYSFHNFQYELKWFVHNTSSLSGELILKKKWCFRIRTSHLSKLLKYLCLVISAHGQFWFFFSTLSFFAWMHYTQFNSILAIILFFFLNDNNCNAYVWLVYRIVMHFVY